MAKYEKRGVGEFEFVLKEIEKSIFSSISASLEEKSSGYINNVRFETRVYERYSWTGGNRLSLTVSLIGFDNTLSLSIMTAGGSQGMFFKINRFGENSFLNSIIPTVERLIK